MARVARIEQFSPNEMAIVHVVNRAVRRCFLMGYDRFTNRNYDYRKRWIEQRIIHLASGFGIDVLGFAILSNHVHLILRQRPDVVATWDDTEVARRWLMLCPTKWNADGSPCEPTEAQLNGIRNDPEKVSEIRSRLSDISWWMRLMCQNIAQRINREDNATGKVWENRFRAIRILDEASLLACSAYVDLNLIRAGLTETLEASNYTSIQRRIEALQHRFNSGDDHQSDSGHSHSVPDESSSANVPNCPPDKNKPRDSFLSPIYANELRNTPQVLPSTSGDRCSDLGFLNMADKEYIKLLDWTARQLVPGKRGRTPNDIPPILERLNLGISAGAWCQMVGNFGKLFKLVAGLPHSVDSHRGKRRHKRFLMSQRARELLSV